MKKRHGQGSLSLFLKGKKKVQIKLSLWPLGIYVDFSDPVNKCRIAWKFCEPSKGQQQGMALTAVQFKFNFWFIGKQKQTILLENNKRFGENQINGQLAGTEKLCFCFDHMNNINIPSWCFYRWRQGKNISVEIKPPIAHVYFHNNHPNNQILL